MRNLKVTEIIRNRQTTEPWIIVSITSACILIVNLTTKENPRPIHALFPGDYGQWERDLDTDSFTNDRPLYSPIKADDLPRILN